MNTQILFDQLINSEIFRALSDSYVVTAHVDVIVITPKDTDTSLIISSSVLKTCMSVADEHNLMIFIRSYNDTPQIILHL